MKKICFVAAVPETIRVFLIEHLRVMIDHYDISIVTNTSNAGFLKDLGLNIDVFPVGIERRITLWKDFSALMQLYHFFRKQRFNAVHSLTPKAGLLSMVAAYAARVPLRIHTFTGQVWATRKGLSRWFLKCFDKVISACATHVFVDSQTQRDFIINEGIVTSGKSNVVADGSICGVDVKRFSPDKDAGGVIRKQLGVDEKDTLFLYLGRLNKDKGMLDLAKAFSIVCDKRKDVHLLIVGPDEEGMKEQMLQICTGCDTRIHYEDFTAVPEKFMASADVFCLPSYREGFGVVIIEAAATGIPAIGTRTYGIIDAIDENVTGYLYQPGDISGLVRYMLRMADSPEERRAMGRRARERVLRLFNRERVTAAFADVYDVFFSRNRAVPDI